MLPDQYRQIIQETDPKTTHGISNQLTSECASDYNIEYDGIFHNVKERTQNKAFVSIHAPLEIEDAIRALRAEKGIEKVTGKGKVSTDQILASYEKRTGKVVKGGNRWKVSLEVEQGILV